MAFTEATLIAQMESDTATATGHKFQIDRFVDNGNSSTDLYVVPVSAPWCGRGSRWVTIAQSNTAAQAWALLQSAFQSNTA